MKPRSLMFTLYGEYIQHYGGEVWIGSLIKMMSQFGISESSSRGATLRMVQQGYFQARKIGNKSYYSLTDKGKRSMQEGVSRVYSIRNLKWDGYWRVVTYSIPENKRELRNQVRKDLTWIGFGMISNSVWVTPNPLEQQVLKMIKEHGLEDHIILFSSSEIVSHDKGEIVQKGWDFDGIDQAYQSFIERYSGKYEALKERAWNEQLTDKECFIERTTLVHEYRKFLFLDPGFPADLLPADWSGNKARELFFNVHQLLSIPAIRYFEDVFDPAPDCEHVSNREKAIHPFINIM